MTYKALKDFIKNRMRMSHIYQPVMLMTLLEKNGMCHQKEIAKSLLMFDESQVEYYEKITNNMVGRVLRNHDIVEKKSKLYKLNGFDNLTNDQINELINLCKQKLDEYINKRGNKIWQHRSKSSGYISGTKRYEVLKRAKFHCELCGISAFERALEVDHIIPRNNGGSDDLSNLQSLCYSCNSMKRDRDDTNFRETIESFEAKHKNCIFCNIEENRIIEEDSLTYVIRDAYPVTNLHTLIIPKRHIKTYFDMGQSEVNSSTRIINHIREQIISEDETVTGFNIGMNSGSSAGQTVFHCHIHLIPRRDGDVENPRGGVRHVIPGKGNY